MVLRVACRLFWYEPRCDERYLAACFRWAESKPQRLCPTDAGVWRIDGLLDKRLKPFGQAIIGISLIFLGIDTIKDGFSSANDISFSEINVHGFAEVLIFVVVGFLLTCVLQSSHATLILTLSALAAGQISIAQGFAIAIGSNLGSSATTALVGMLGSDRNGQKWR